MTSSPTCIGRYQIVEPIGQGGMGTLYLAWDPKLDRRIAIKVLKDDDAELRERFAREARSAARLRHPNIVTIFDVGDHGDQPFIAMEYVEGVTLAHVIRERRPLTTARKVELIEELCDGLAFAHRAGIVHRDVKPANLMVSTEGPLKILDFGIARSVVGTGMTQVGRVIGTLNYMSPEQLAGYQVDLRSDVFAVGAVCYELLSCRQAFPGGLSDGLYQRIFQEPPQPLAVHVPNLDPELIRIVDRALEKEARHRYQDLVAMKNDLQRVRGRLDPATVRVPPAAPGVMAPTIAVETGPTPARASWPAPTATVRLPGARRPGTSAVRWLIGIVAIVLVGLGVVWGVTRNTDQDPSQEARPAEVPQTPPESPPSPVIEPAPPPPPLPVGKTAPPPPSRPEPERSPPPVILPTRPAAAPRECARLLERVSLGEELTADEQVFLKRHCRQ